MTSDTRITVSLALLYFLNGFMNVFGPSKAFLPLVFLDSFLLAALSVVFLVLPKFTKLNFIFVIFFLCFTVQGLFITGVFQPNAFEIALNIGFVICCALLYFISIFQFPKISIITVLPFVMFIFSILFGYIQVPVYFILGSSVIAGLLQVYILARPEMVEHLPIPYKRFYLLMSLMVFFDVLSFIFFKINAPEVDFHY